jgi:hypothetical protein
MSAVMTGLEESAGAKARVRLPLRERVFEASVVIPTVVALGWASSRVLASLGRSETEDLVIWILLIASVELIPVPLWRGTIISMGFPLLMAVAFLYPPAVAGAARS